MFGGLRRRRRLEGALSLAMVMTYAAALMSNTQCMSAKTVKCMPPPESVKCMTRAESVKCKLPHAKLVRQAVEGLYADEVQPYLGIVRARMEELGAVGGRELEGKIVKAVESSSWAWLDYSEYEQNPVVVLHEHAARWIDPKGPDVYSAETWERWEAIFAVLAKGGFEFPGSRYACARHLGTCSEFVDFTVGARLHIVQLCLKRGMLRYADRKSSKRSRASPPTIEAVDLTDGRVCEDTSQRGPSTKSACRQRGPSTKSASLAKCVAESEVAATVYPCLLPELPEKGETECGRAWFEEMESKEGVVLDNRRTFLHIPDAVPASSFSKSLPSALYESDRSDADRAVLVCR